MKDRALSKAGVRNATHQRILLDKLPCDILTSKEALADKTAVQVNAPRALLVFFWKGMVHAFAQLELQQVDLPAHSERR